MTTISSSTPGASERGRAEPSDGSETISPMRNGKDSGPARAEVISILPVHVSVSDFVRDGEKKLLITTDGALVRVFSADACLTALAGWEVAGTDRVLTLQWWRPSLKDPLYLATTLLFLTAQERSQGKEAGSVHRFRLSVRPQHFPPPSNRIRFYRKAA